MCGIAGLVRAAAAPWASEPVVRGMTDALRHRGPDDAGFWADDATGVALGHRRLAILDLSSDGHQPMQHTSGRWVLSYNGEVYNYRQLRDELQRAGVTFRSASDTEVILAGIAHWGLEVTVKRLEGIFAFALFDTTTRRFFLVRDHVGVKPLYYGVTGGTFAFASELRPFDAIPGFAAKLDVASIDALLRYSYIPAPATIFTGIHKLPPGCIGEVNLGDVTAPLRIMPYWSARQVAEDGVRDPFSGTTEDAIDALDTLLRSAIGAQMVSDVPLGAFLSGGIDSSTVVSLMQAASAQPIRTFSIGFDEAAYNEAHAARAVATHLGTSHTEFYVTPADALAVIPQLPTLYDEPFADSSQIPTYLVSQLARRSVTVALSGDGGDELFAGYNRHRLGERLWRTLRNIPLPLRTAVARAALSVPPARYEQLFGRGESSVGPAGRKGFQLHKLAGLLDAPTESTLYERMTSQWNGMPSGVAGRHAGGPRLLTAPAVDTLTERMMVWDMETYLPDDVLTKVDRASMACALEARVPLLDPRVVEFAWRLPLSLKLRDGTGKWILRQVLYRYVPSQLVDRPKVGFAVPIDSWLRGPLRDWAESLLSVDALARSGVLDAALIRLIWSRHLLGQIDAQQTLWNVLMFQAWLAHRTR